MAEESETVNVEGEEVNEEIVDDEEVEKTDEAAAAAAEEEAARVAAEEEAAAAAAEEAARVAAEEEAVAAEEAARVQAEEDAAAEPVVEEETVPVVTNNLCSLKTLVEVLGKWSGGEIRRRNVEDLLKEGSEVDENLDNLEKVVEVLQLWIKEGVSIKEHNHFKNLDEYTLIGESRNLSEEKR